MSYFTEKIERIKTKFERIERTSEGKSLMEAEDKNEENKIINNIIKKITFLTNVRKIVS